MLTVFMEYKVSPDFIQLYESQMDSVINELKASGASDIQWYRAADQPSLYVECFQVNDQATYDTIKKNRTSLQHPVFSILDECVTGGLEKIHCWAFEKLNTSLNDSYVKQFQDHLLTWYNENKRTLPWRENQDPYRVWVSEIMLQQTRVDTVIPYFERFTQLFPTLQDLAYADEEKVLKAWEGLGYYSRVRNLQTAVKEVCESYGGKVPNTPKEIAGLKGVGPYTAGAVLSIAYGIPEPAVDGNVMRVLSRILLIEEDISKPKTRVLFEKAVRELISHEDPSSFNQALMELGALICTPKSPACLLCPMRELCRGFESGRQAELPVKLGKTKVRKAKMTAGVLLNHDGEILIHKRPSEGLLANMWEFPNTEYVGEHKDAEVEALVGYVQEQTDFGAVVEEKAGYIEHVFSHLKWEIQIWQGKIESEDDLEQLPADWKWVRVDELENYPFPVSHQKIILLIKEALIV